MTLPLVKSIIIEIILKVLIARKMRRTVIMIIIPLNKTLIICCKIDKGEMKYGMCK